MADQGWFIVEEVLLCVHEYYDSLDVMLPVPFCLPERVNQHSN